MLRGSRGRKYYLQYAWWTPSGSWFGARPQPLTLKLSAELRLGIVWPIPFVTPCVDCLLSLLCSLLALAYCWFSTLMCVYSGRLQDFLVCPLAFVLLSMAW